MAYELLVSDVLHSDQCLKDSSILLLGALSFSLPSSIPLYEYTINLCLSTVDVHLDRFDLGL